MYKNWQGSYKGSGHSSTLSRSPRTPDLGTPVTSERSGHTGLSNGLTPSPYRSHNFKPALDPKPAQRQQPKANPGRNLCYAFAATNLCGGANSPTPRNKNLDCFQSQIRSFPQSAEPRPSLPLPNPTLNSGGWPYPIPYGTNPSFEPGARSNQQNRNPNPGFGATHGSHRLGGYDTRIFPQHKPFPRREPLAPLDVNTRLGFQNKVSATPTTGVYQSKGYSAFSIYADPDAGRFHQQGAKSYDWHNAFPTSNLNEATQANHFYTNDNGPISNREGIFRTEDLRESLPRPTPVLDRPQRPTIPTGFLPMAAVIDPQERARSYSIQDVVNAETRAHFSIRYHGMHTVANASAEHLAPEKNCALWLTNLPPNVTPMELLASIRNIGRIWCTFINTPDYISHTTAAAKVVFFTPEAAQKLLGFSLTESLMIRDFDVKVTLNRIKYPGHEVTGKMSRVLIITGSDDFVNEASLTQFFKDRFIFQMDEVIPLIKAAGRAVVEYRFGSYRCQSQMGKMALEKDRPVGFQKVEFGDDPCETGDTLASYGIAADRIQGKDI